ncbi:hypothetical protein [Granulicella aggregans]|nr:hypothetical protein [Granulicella aggregans]
MRVRWFQCNLGLSGWLAAGGMIALSAALALGQEAGFLDTRPGSQPAPSITGGSADGGGIGCGGCVVMNPLKVEIERLTLIDRGPSPGVEWTIRVTNQTKNPIQLPSSLSWSGSAVSGSMGRTKAQRIYFGETADCEASSDRAASKYRAGASMYAPPDGARDVVTLEAGQWVTVVGYGAACGFPRAGSDSYAVSVGLTQVEWYRAKEGDREDSRSVYSMVSSQPVNWDGAHDFVKANTTKGGN